MDFQVYLSLIGEKQGEIIGPVTQKGREGKIEISRLEHNLSYQLLQGRAYATKSIHTPLTLWKGLDSTTPLLYKAFCEQERFKKFEITFWPLYPTPALAPQIKGKEKLAKPPLPSDNHPAFYLRLTGAFFTAISMHYGSQMDMVLPSGLEKIDVSYGLIEWNWLDSVSWNSSWS
jgi:type VI protein secretion system component Hcp